MTNYVVTAPLVGVNGADGKVKYLFKDSPVPLDVSAADIERLEEGGLIVNLSPVVTPASTFPDGIPSEDWKVPELLAYAEEFGIDLGDAKKKADIVPLLTAPPVNDDSAGNGDGAA
ncbi:hypothetical protein [Rhodococcus qingshengii]|uniref:hypothetical protein n=1 Tax=Rhodococcus qingshengii TaxID=334542 RepID=UPI001AE0DF03|nr:hypothetical protein [Rhodococcus qingshengii]MCQ4148680.1 hypothetical protein [Rhodococcus qingshengii]